MKPIVLLAVVLLSGCFDKGAMSPEMKAESVYTTEISKCTVDSQTKLESKACECRADIRWHVPTPNACDEFATMKGKTP